MAKEFTYKGKTIEELGKLKTEELAGLLTSRKRRTLKRGLKDVHKKLLKKIENHKNPIKPIRTHDRDMIILPVMIGKRFAIHNGKEWTAVEIPKQAIGKNLGELAITNKKVQHSGPGIGATRGTKFTAVK